MSLFKKNNFLFAAFVAVFVAASCSVFASRFAYAGEPKEYKIQISPAHGEIDNLQPGKSYTQSFQIQNTGDYTLDYAITIAPYSVDDSYASNFEHLSDYNEIMDWITIDQPEGSVKAGDRLDIKYTINVPEDAPAGGQNAALLIRALGTTDVSGSTSVEAIRQIGYILYTNVAGQTRTTGKILENKVPGFLFTSPVVLSSTVENSGNVYTRASYTVEIKNFFGDSIAFSNVDKPDTLVLLPESTRYNEITWEEAPQLGIFKVRQTIKIFDEENTVEKILFICPIWFLVIIILFIAMAISWVVSRIRSRKNA